jgi:signal transduction histidine kinase
MLDHFETVRVSKSGRLVNVSATISPVRDETGRIIAVSKIVRDVTEQRRLQDEREQLLIAAEASNRAKDDLLATVSHELRTPLNSILGYARLLEKDALDEAGRRHAIAVIGRSALTQVQLVDDLLELSRAAAGRMQLTLERCEIVPMIEDALDAVKPAADAKGITIARTYEPDAGSIMCAPERLRQIVWNVAMNAIKFTGAGGRVDVGVRRAGVDVEIVVSDNGIGIASDLLPHVFERFRQGDSSSTRVHGGLGLGLALVKSLVELQGGTVKAESKGKGTGATFTIRFPGCGDGA